VSDFAVYGVPNPMPTLYHYTFLAPLRQEYRDDGSEIILTIPCNIKGSRISEICLLGTDRTIYAIRVKIPSCPDKNISDEENNKITSLVEHMLGVLRLTYDLKVDFVREGNSYIQLIGVVEDGQESNFEAKIWEEVFKDVNINVDSIRATFCRTVKIKDVVKLCADAVNSALPLQYRYLSLYKLFERDFTKNKKWAKEFKELLQPFEGEFRALKLTKMELFAFIIDLRNKCAHIVLGKKKSPGILGLESPDARLVDVFMPLFVKIAGEHVNNKYKGILEVAVSPLVPPRRAD
jgi:hypothetical protein